MACFTNLGKKTTVQVRRKALIITYYWPPAGGPGVQRWLKFAKYLSLYDVDPIIYAPENPDYPLLDESLIDDIPPHIKVIKQPIKEPYRYAKLLSKKTNNISKGIIAEKSKQSITEKLLLFIRGNFFIPDARKNWVKPSVVFLEKYLKNNPVDAIISTGPPHSLHLIGVELKKRIKVKWLADFRDPWTTIGYHKQLNLTRRSKQRHEELESQVLNSADQIIVTSYYTKKNFSRITDKPIEVITNGYDTEAANINTALDKKFSISHIGSLLSERNPENLWKALADILDENEEFTKDFELNLVGAVSEDVLKSISNFGISDYLNIIGYISHNESIRYQKKSQVLLLIEIDSNETKSIIPGKLFEYMVSNRPILAIGPEGSDVEKIIAKTDTGNYFLYEELDKIKTIILQYYNSFKKGDLQSYPTGLEEYNRKSLTKALAELI